MGGNIPFKQRAIAHKARFVVAAGAAMFSTRAQAAFLQTPLRNATQKGFVAWVIEISSQQPPSP